MKRILLLFIPLICIALSSSCAIQDSDDPRDIDYDSYSFAKSTIETVLKCLDENDSQTLKELFSESVILKYDVNKQIEDATTFYEGTSVSCDEIHSDIRESSFRNDHYDYKSITIEMNVVTDQNKRYTIECVYILVDDKDETNVGLSKLFVWDFYDPIGNYYLVGDDGDYPKS